MTIRIRPRTSDPISALSDDPVGEAMNVGDLIHIFTD